MRVLTLDGAGGGASAGLVVDGAVLRDVSAPPGRGSAAALAGLAHDVLGGVMPDLVAVTVGPGSFTGVRSALALAHGIGLGAGVPVVGVPVGAAVRAGLAEAPVWVAMDGRRGWVFLDDGEQTVSVALDALPAPGRAVAVAGNAAAAVVARLGERGQALRLLDVAAPSAAGIAACAGSGGVAALPVYVDGPQARMGTGGRPEPA